MQISIISTSIETKPTAKGSYQQLEVVFKNLTYQGKVESKKVMSFGAGASAFSTLSKADQGSVWEVTVVKNAQGYNDWTSVVASEGSSAPAPSAAPGAINSSKAAVSPKSTYETPEERAQRQILIVRQSSVSSALTLHSMGAKSSPKLEDVLDTAQKISDFVFQTKSAGATGFDDLPDFDVPEVM